jgi:membrane dipeptidase
MQEGGLDAMFFAVFVWQGERTPDGNAKAKASTLRTLNAIRASIARHIHLAEIAYSPDEILQIVRKNKRAILIGLENGYGIGNDLSLIKNYYDLGVRYITLCHMKNNDICDSANDSTEYGGLSEFGRQVIHEMNRVGMLIDVSHISDTAFYDVLEFSQAPVFASHSGCRAICDNPRNLSDEMLKALAEKDGVVQINLYTGYIKSGIENAARDSALNVYWTKYPDLDEMNLDQRLIAYHERDILENNIHRDWQAWLTWLTTSITL